MRRWAASAFLVSFIAFSSSAAAGRVGVGDQAPGVQPKALFNADFNFKSSQELRGSLVFIEYWQTW